MVGEVALTQDTRAWVLFLVSHFLVVQTGTFFLDLLSYLQMSWTKANISRFLTDEDLPVPTFLGIGRFYWRVAKEEMGR